MKTKKGVLILTIGLLIFCGSFTALAIEWKTTNQATIAWDAVTTLLDGSPVPATNAIKYRIYIVNAATDPNKANPALLTDPPIDALEYTLTLNTEGKYIVGVASVRFDETGAEVEQSDINWSDTNGDQTPNPFGLVYYIRPAIPLNLR